MSIDKRFNLIKYEIRIEIDTKISKDLMWLKSDLTVRGI